jgi:hypothetical protein
MLLYERLAAMPEEKRLNTLENLPSYLANLGQTGRLQTILTTYDFLKAKVDAIGVAHIPQFKERKNRIANTLDQAGEEPADEELVVPGRAFASVSQRGYARDQCPQNTGTSSAS